MPVIPIRGLAAKGIAPDRPPYDLPQEYAWIGHNMRMVQGQISSAPGYDRHVIADTGDGAIDGTDLIPHSMGGWVTGNSQAWLFCCETQTAENRMYVYDGNTMRDASPGGLPVTPNHWEFHSMGQRMIAHSPTEIPLYLDSVAGTYTQLTGWDTRPGGDGWRCNILAPFGAFLVAAPITDGAEFRASSVAWSHEMPPDINNGEINWDYSDPTKLAGENVLDHEAGEILAMVPLGQQLMIFCEFAVWAMSFVGGQLVFQFRQVFTDDGILNRHSVAKVDDNRLAVIGRHNIYITDGNSKQFIADGRTRYFFYRELQDQRICMVHTELIRDDIIFAYASDPAEVDPDNQVYDKALIYNWRYDAWTTQDLPQVSDMKDMPILQGYLTWDEVTETWVVVRGPWGEGIAVGTLLPIWASAGNKLVYRDISGWQFDGSAIPWRLRMEQMDLDTILASMQLPPTTDRWKYVRKLWPQLSGDGVINIGGKALQTYAPWIDYDVNVEPLPVLGAFDIGVNYKVDLEIHGRYLCLEFVPASSGVEDTARFVGADVDLSPRTYRQ